MLDQYAGRTRICTVETVKATRFTSQPMGRMASRDGNLTIADLGQRVAATLLATCRPCKLLPTVERVIGIGRQAGVEIWGRRSIDHIALSEDLMVQSLEVASSLHDGCKLSDHFGVAAEVIVR